MQLLRRGVQPGRLGVCARDGAGDTASGEIVARGRPVLASFDDIPWDRLPDEATRSMLRRYAAERKLGRFKVYSGDHRQGTVKAVE